MIGNQIQFEVIERKNKHRKSGKEWALDIRFVGEYRWTIYTWKNKPSDKMIEETKEIIMRSFLFYHNHLRIPKFDLREVK